MSQNYGFYLLNIFANPKKVSRAIIEEKKLIKITLYSFLIGSALYIFIVLLGYQALGWGSFPYRLYYPHYFSLYWWEVFVVPIWGLVIAFGFAIPGYLLGKLLGGKATFKQVIAFVMLASIVSLPVFVIVDIITITTEPDWIVRFAKYGENIASYSEYPNKFLWIIQNSYSYVAMTWQGVVTIIGLSIIHKIRWYKNLPALVLGNGILFLFLILIRNYVALIV